MELASLAEINEAELKLRESQNFSQKISETTPGLVTVYQIADGRYLYVNAAVKAILGYDPQDFLSRGIEFVSSLIHPEDVARLMEENQKAVEKANKQYPHYNDDDIKEFEYRLKHKLGHYVWVHTYGVVFSRNAEGVVDKLLNISVDITARKNSEEELRRTKDELQKLNDELEQKVLERTRELEKEKLELKKQTERNKLVDKATNDVVWDTNLLTNEIIYNENYSRLFGYLLPGVINSNSWTARLHPDDSERVLAGINRVMKNKEEQWADEYRFKRKDNSYAHILDRGCILYSEDGTAYRMVGCMTDVSTLKEAEDIAKSNEIKFRRIYESNMLGMLFVNLDGTVVDANDAFLNMIGYTKKELQSDLINLYAITPPEYHHLSDNAVVQLKDSGVCLPFEKEYLHKSGRRVAVLIGAAIIDQENGTAVIYTIDVSESKEANRIIKENEDRFRFLADAIPQKVWTATADGKVDYMNKVWMDYTGESFEQMQQSFDFIHPEDYSRSMQIWADAIKNGSQFEIEHRYKRADGSYRWHLSRGVAQRDEDGKIVMWVGTNTDIHDQKTFAEALRISEDYFRELSDNVPFMIWKVDNKGKAIYVNKSWMAFTGLSLEESLGFGWARAVHPEEQEKEAINFAEALSKQVPYNSKFRLRRKDGAYRYVLGQSTPLFNPVFIGYIGSLTDITEQELAQQATELLMQKKDEFMSIASHELKTPITSMKAYLQIVERLSSQHEGLFTVHEFIKKANKQVGKLTVLVQDLLDVTKIHAGKMMFNKTNFNIGEIIEECLDEVQNNSNKHTIEVTGDLELEIYADKHRIEQVLTNFLSNAIKYSPDADSILIDASAEGNMLKLAVKDFGIGIPENKRQYVFDRFFRVQESSQKFSGLGLGLYISSEIISRHGGEVHVESTEGEGSTFFFKLPLSGKENN